MKRVLISKYGLDIDYEKNVMYYENLPLIGNHQHCSCLYCQNYAATSECFPKEVQLLFKELGIDPKKDAEVSHFDNGKNKKHMYVATYRVYGKLIKQPNEKEIIIYWGNKEDYFRIGFDYYHGEQNEVAFELWVEAFLPWVLDGDSYPDPE